MKLSGAEFFLILVVVCVGLFGNLKLHFNNRDRNQHIRWNTSIYGLSIIILICGILTPPDILSNIIFSIPISIIYLIIVRKIVFKVI